MKLTVDRTAFSAALGVAAVVQDSSNTLYHNTRLTAQDNKLFVLASNGVVNVRLTLSAAVRSDGAVVAPCEMLREFVASMPDDDENVEVSFSKNKLTVACNGSVFESRTIPEDAYPDIKFFLPGDMYPIESSVLADSLKAVYPFCGTEESGAKWMETVLFNLKDGYLMSSDKRRIAKYGLPFRGQQVEAVSVKACEILSTILPRMPETVNIGLSNKSLVIDGENIAFSALLLAENKFPHVAVDSLFTADTLATILIDPKELKDILTAISKMAAKSFGGEMNCGLKLKGGKVEFTYTSDNGNLSRPSKSASYTGTDVELLFNVRFPVPALQKMKKEIKVVVKRMKNGAKPLFFDYGNYVLFCSTL